MDLKLGIHILHFDANVFLLLFQKVGLYRVFTSCLDQTLITRVIKDINDCLRHY